MKAIVYTRYGSPDVLHLEDVAKPLPGDDEILVRVYAISINAINWPFVTGEPFLVRFVTGGY